MPTNRRRHRLACWLGYHNPQLHDRRPLWPDWLTVLVVLTWAIVLLCAWWPLLF